MNLIFPMFIEVGRFRLLGGQGLVFWGGQGLEYWGGQGLEYWGGGARFRILGGQGLEYWGGGQGGAKFPAGT